VTCCVPSLHMTGRVFPQFPDSSIRNCYSYHWTMYKLLTQLRNRITGFIVGSCLTSTCVATGIPLLCSCLAEEDVGAQGHLSLQFWQRFLLNQALYSKAIEVISQNHLRVICCRRSEVRIADVLFHRNCMFITIIVSGHFSLVDYRLADLDFVALVWWW
jgi:hypothetical protein